MKIIAALMITVTMAMGVDRAEEAFSAHQVKYAKMAREHSNQGERLKELLSDRYIPAYRATSWGQVYNDSGYGNADSCLYYGDLFNVHLHSENALRYYQAGAALGDPICNIRAEQLQQDMLLRSDAHKWQQFNSRAARNGRFGYACLFGFACYAAGTQFFRVTDKFMDE